ncbi:MAG: TadA family conjugal transfer-associated ATPase [Actinomycetes bacterium]
MSGEPAVVPAPLLERVRSRLAEAGDDPTPARVAAALRQEGRLLPDTAVLGVITALRAELVGLGPLEPLVRDEAVTDVLVNAPDEVWVDRGVGLERVEAGFPDEAGLRRFAQRLASGAGRRLDDAVPFVDARLPGGVRLHAVLPPVSPRGTVVSLRVPPRRTYSLEALVACGTLAPTVADVLLGLVRSRRAFLVSGGTGTGKTTLLSSLLSCAAPSERLVLVEDAGELAPAHPHVVRLQARAPNVEGVGTVSLSALVRQALRMRPDRLVVGEVRGAEVVDLLAALNTGHDGGCGTLHANGAAEVPARLEALGMSAGLSRTAVHSQLSAAVHVLLHLRRGTTGLRYLSEVCVLRRRPDGVVETVEALRARADGQVRGGPGSAALAELVPMTRAAPDPLDGLVSAERDVAT